MSPMLTYYLIVVSVTGASAILHRKRRRERRMLPESARRLGRLGLMLPPAACACGVRSQPIKLVTVGQPHATRILCALCGRPCMPPSYEHQLHGIPTSH